MCGNVRAAQAAQTAQTAHSVTIASRSTVPSPKHSEYRCAVAMLLSTHQVCTIGLESIGINVPKQRRMSYEAVVESFQKHYGPKPLDVADMWYDLTQTDIPGAALNDKEKTLKGFVCLFVF